MQHSNLSQGHLLTNKVDINLNVFGATVMDRISCHVNCANIITIDNGSTREWHVKLLKQLAQPTTFCHSMCNSSVLSFSTRARDGGLAFGRPRHKIVTKVYTIARGRTSGGQPAQSAFEYAVRESTRPVPM